jgi:hypothetical protein
MNYTNVAKEAYEMYRAFRDECFDAHQAFELTKVWLREDLKRNTSCSETTVINNVETRINTAGRIVMKNGTNLDVFEVTRSESGSIFMLTNCGMYSAVQIGTDYDYYRFNKAAAAWRETDDVDYFVLFE